MDHFDSSALDSDELDALGQAASQALEGVQCGVPFVVPADAADGYENHVEKARRVARARHGGNLGRSPVWVGDEALSTLSELLRAAPSLPDLYEAQRSLREP